MNDNLEESRQRTIAAIAEIRAEVERQASSRSAAESVALDHALAELRRRAAISAHWGIVPTWPILGRFEVLAKRSMRILLRWYVNPIVEQQNRFNLAVIAAMYDLEAQIHARNSDKAHDSAVWDRYQPK